MRTLFDMARALAFALAILAVMLPGVGRDSGAARASELDPSAHVARTVTMPADWHDKAITHPTDAPVDLAISLDQQLYPALLPLIRAFAAERDLTVAVQSGTCGISAGALVEKKADMGGFCCPPGPTDRLPGLTFHTIGIGALALIRHPDNPVGTVTAEEARALFAGTARLWSDLSTAPATAPRDPVAPIIRLHCKTRPGHWKLLHETADDFSIEALEVGTIEDMIAQVSRRPAAIGYETLWHLRRTAAETPVATLRIDGVSPEDSAAVAAGAYPFYRVFNITTWSADHLADADAQALAAHLVASADALPPVYGLVAAGHLRAAGWRFEGDEVIAPPQDVARHGGRGE